MPGDVYREIIRLDSLELSREYMVLLIHASHCRAVSLFHFMDVNRAVFEIDERLRYRTYKLSISRLRQ